MSTKYHVISHTHWDREWYQPLESMKLRLIDLMDHVLELLRAQSEYRFHLDAQTIVMEDYLSVRPGRREELKRYISEGRLLVGPWYVQNDFYLTSGEATVRNLLIGIGMAQEFGRCTMVGYCADQFGVTAQLPQIYRQFGIQSCIFGRGYNFEKPRKADFYWRSEDGSEVLCEFMTFWYNNAQRFPADIEKSMEMLRFIDKNLRSTCQTEEFLLMNGVDHLEAQEDLLPILQKLNERLTDGSRIFQSTMPEYVEALPTAVQEKTLTHYTGGMRNGSVWNLLAGTLSSRVALKQHNDRCQRMLERQLEPLYTVLAQAGVKDYPHDILRYLWKTLIQNHPHDSICGCSVDEVHRNMMDRFSRVETCAQDLLARGMQIMGDYADRSGLSTQEYLLTVFNPVQESRTELLEFTAEFPVTEQVRSFAVIGPDGEPARFRVLSKEARAKGIVTPINLPGVVNVDAFHVLLEVRQLPGLTFRTYRIIPSQEEQPLQPAEKTGGTVLENQFLRAEIQPNGTIDLLQKETGKVMRGLFLLEDEAEIGDSYVHFGLAGCPPVTSAHAEAKIEMQADGELRQRAEIRYSMQIPAQYCEAEKRRSETLTELPVCLTLTLETESRILAAEVSVENRAADHRLRMCFPTGISDDVSYSGNPFDAIARSRSEAHAPGHVTDQPDSDWIAVDGSPAGVAIFNVGLHEYEHDADGSLLLTLLRCEGYISHDPYGEGELVEDKWRAKDSQCIGAQTMQLAVYPYTSDHRTARAAQRACCFTTPLLCGFQPVDDRKFSGGRSFVQGCDNPEFFFRPKEHPKTVLPAQETLFTLEDASGAIVLSAVKEAESGGRMILRCYSTADRPVSCTVRFAKPVHVFRSDLRESAGEELPQKPDGTVTVQVAPKEIITLAVKKR